MDDIAFFNTNGLGIRGGIFSEAGKVSADHAVHEAASEIPTLPGAEIGTAAEDPASATAETSTMRQRRPTKVQTLDVTAPSEAPGTESIEVGLARTDTAPASIDIGASTNREPSLSETKKWFGKIGRPQSESSQTVINGPVNASQESLSKQRSRNGERTSLTATPNPAESSTTSENSTRPPSPPLGGDISSYSPPPNRLSIGSINKATSDQTVPAPLDNATESSSTAALLTSLRARDKKAIQSQVNSQVNTARDAVKKWGVNWAKRRTNFPNKLDEREGSRPAALYGQPEEESVIRSSNAPDSPSQTQSPTLKERLDAAAHQASTRQRSASSASASSATGLRPTLLQSPSKSAVAPVNPSTSPPQWTLASHPMSEAARDTVPTPHPPRASNGNAVYTQPSAGRTMVVPRVPKRPGEVIGMGSHPESGFVRRISAEDRVESRDGESVLPARRSAKTSASVQEAGEIPLPSMAIDPPQCPPAALDRTSQAKSAEDSGSPTSPLVRSDSAPPASVSPHHPPYNPLPTYIATDSPSTDDEPAPRVEGTPDTQSQSEVDLRSGSSSAEDTLRMVARRHEENRSARQSDESPR